MSDIVQIADFVGVHKIPTKCFNIADLQAYIDRYETEYLCDLLEEDTQDFIANLTNGVPTDPVFLSWYNPFCELNKNCGYCKVMEKSKGIKDILLGFIYYHYTRKKYMSLSSNGLYVDEEESGDVLSPVNQEAAALDFYNESVESFNAVYNKKNGCCIEKMVITTIVI